MQVDASAGSAGGQGARIPWTGRESGPFAAAGQSYAGCRDNFLQGEDARAGVEVEGSDGVNGIHEAVWCGAECRRKTRAGQGATGERELESVSEFGQASVLRTTSGTAMRLSRASQSTGRRGEFWRPRK